MKAALTVAFLFSEKKLQEVRSLSSKND